MIDSYENSFSGYGMTDAPSLLDQIPLYTKIINDLSKGNLGIGYFDFKNRKSKLSRTLDEILFDLDHDNDELSSFILFMDAQNASDLVKFLLDLNHFESSVRNRSSKLSNTTETIVDELQTTSSYEKTSKNVQGTVDEALSIFKRYISKDSKLSIEIPETLITETINRICPENGAPIQQDCFASVKEFVFNQIQNQFFDKYVTSDYHHKYILNILDTQNLTLYDILYDDLAVVFFLEYLEQENVSDLLKFLVQAEMFSRNFENLAIRQDDHSKIDLKDLYKQWQDDAMVIYDNFISLQAKRPIGFDSLIRRQVEINISIDLDMDKPDADLLINTYSKCFFVPMLIVFCILHKVYFERFLGSSMFQKYKTEIRLNSRSSRASISSFSSLEQVEHIELEQRKPPTTQTEIHSKDPSPAQQETKYTAIPQQDSIWNLSEPLIGEVNLEASNSYSLANFKRKFVKFRKTIAAFNKRRHLNKNNDDNDEDEDEYEKAEKVAAQLINEVIRANQQLNS